MKQLLQSEFNKGGKIYKNISSPETSGTQTQVTNINLSDNLLKLSTDNGATFIDVATQQGNSNKSEIDGLLSQTSTMLSNIQNLENNNIKIKNANSGFSAGDGATATRGGAIGGYATATVGGAIGNAATAGAGGAVGSGATTTVGGAIGSSAEATNGGAIGNYAKATNGGAIGNYAKAGNGFSGGNNAQVGKDSDGNYIDAIQLGAGTNNTPKTLQVYDNKVYDFNKDSLYCRLLNDKTPAVVETLWEGSFSNTSGNSLTLSNYSQYDYFIVRGEATGIYTTVIRRLSQDQTYGIVKKSGDSNGFFVFDINISSAGVITFGSAGYYPPNNYTLTDYTNSGYFWIREIVGVKLCKE